jgi:phage terminase large subunit-like protein
MGLVSAGRLRELAVPLGGRWSETRGELALRNGHVVSVRSADRPDAIRGLTLDTALWVDEAPLVSRQAWDAAQGCLVAAAAPRVLLTGTPKGRTGWLFELWRQRDAEVARFRFRSGDSPVANPAVIARLRASYGALAAAQELDAVFTDDRSQPFPPDAVDRFLVADALPFRGARRSLGLDLAKQKDFTVCTLMNEFGEAWVLGRWRHVAWPDTEARVVRLAEEHEALVVIDVGHGGGFGGALHDYLVRALGKARLLPVRTGNLGVKAELIETLSADVEHGRLRAERAGPHADQLRHELLWFAATRRVSAGVERITYEGPAGEEEHDDCVLSLALANWGRLHGWSAPPRRSRLSSFAKKGKMEARGGGASPYLFGG